MQLVEKYKSLNEVGPESRLNQKFCLWTAYFIYLWKYNYVFESFRLVEVRLRKPRRIFYLLDY